jgi:hypothetical protein
MTRANVDQVVQLGVETVPGTLVPATRRIPGISFDIKAVIETQKHRAKGSNVTTASAIHKLWANGPYNGIVDYNSIVYILSGLCGLIGAAPVQIGATAGWTWDFNPVSTGPDPFPKTYSLEKGDDEAAQFLAHLVFQSFGIEINNNTLTMSGNLFGRFPADDETLTPTSTSNEIWQLVINATSGSYTLTYGGNETAAIDFDATPAELLNALTDLVNVNVGDFQVTGGPGDDGGTTPYFIEGIGALAGTNLTPPTVNDTLLVGGGAVGTLTTTQAGGVAGTVTSVAQRPASRMQANIYIDPTFGAIGTTKVTHAYQASLNVGDKQQPFWALNTDYDSFLDAIRVPADVAFAFSTAHNAQSRALFNEISANPTKYVRFLLQGENIGVSADEMIRIDMAGKFEAIEEEPDENGPLGYKYTFTAQHDASMGGAYKVHVVNRLSALA